MVKAFALTLATTLSTIVLAAPPAQAAPGDGKSAGEAKTNRDSSWGCGGACRPIIR
ncbi:hypothetical protein [Nocardioides stalactiti]|uniref:hypothetical protein n=1 Tax=Nocardioides stalactiti TaxID=2755356 RepID=UPI001600677D|nr:hypothetical protein [Nocardioides stalactiti]